MWAYRSVLDGIPRVLTLALHKDLYIGYDTYHCGITKIWKEGVLKVGAVYNQKHGPQPESKGSKYLDRPMTESGWYVQPAGGTKKDVRNCTVQFQGYRFENGKIALRYQLKIDSTQDAVVEEWPEYVEGVSGPKLERVYVWVKPPPKDLDVLAKIVTDGLPNPEGISQNSTFNVLSRSEKLTLSKPIWSMEGLLKIKSDSPTILTLQLDPAALLP